MSVNLTNEEVVGELRKLIKLAEGTAGTVRRKRAIRDSERAMWLADLTLRVNALERAIALVEGRAA